MNDWWQSLQERERILVIVMSALVAFSLVYLFILKPLFSGADQYRERVMVAEEDLNYMRKIAPRLNRTTPAARPRTNETPIAIVARTTPAFGLNTRNVQQAQEKLRVQLNDSSFNSMMEWVGDLHKKHGLQVSSASLTGEDDPGVVTGTVTLEKSP